MIAERTLESLEQPEKLHAGLQSALRIGKPAEEPELEPVSSNPEPASRFARVYAWVMARFAWALSFFLPAKQEEKPSPEIGVPHGTTAAVVLVENIEVADYTFGKRIKFCRTQNYRVLARTLNKGDGGEYPPTFKTRLSADVEPNLGFHSARLLVSVNGSVSARVLEWDPQPTEEELACAAV